VTALVEVDALSTTFGTAVNPATLKLLFNRVGMGLYGGALRAAAALRPELCAQLLMSDETTQTRVEVAALARRVMGDPHRSAFVTRVWLAGARNVGAWLTGQRNDNALMTALTPLSLSGIRCPTLIVHGTADALAAHSTYAATQIPGAEVRSIADAGHRGLWINDDAADQQAFVVSWLREHV
jgi:pimeloyl-ACP methyl ester carboxylesterase